MKSCVTKLYDWTKYQPKEEARRWRVRDEEIDQRLALLARNRAADRDVDTVRLRDSVACRGESAAKRWNQPLLLIYPGYGMCDKALEDALIGMKVGESRTVAAAEGDVTLTVLRVVRREPHPVDDELVKLEAIEGVETLADYRKWYRETTEAKNRCEQPQRMAYGLLHTIEEGSEYDIDPDEESAAIRERANSFYDAMVAAGRDMTVPDEGTEFLTEEQAREQCYQQMLPFYRNYVVCVAVTEQIGGMDYEDAFQQGLAEAAASHGQKPEDLLKGGRTWSVEEYAMESMALKVLAGVCEKYLED